MQHHKYSLTELDNMLPWERDIYVNMLLGYLEEETERIKDMIPHAEFELLEDTVHPIDRLDVARLAALICRKSQVIL
jgi:hypothetical protein